MKTTIRIALCGAMMGTLVQAQALPVAEIDAGGLTFDFEKASRELFRRGTDGKNLLAADGSFDKVGKPGDWGGWDLGYLDFHGFAEGDPIRRDVLKYIHRTVTNGEATVTADEELRTVLCGGDAAKARGIVIGFSNRVKIRDFEGGPYRLFFEYKERGGSGGERLCSFSLSDGKFKKDFWTLARENSGVWRECVHEMTLEPGCEPYICFRHHGVGTLSIRNVRFEKVRSSHPIETLLVPCGQLDNVFAVSQGQPGCLLFSWRACTDEKYDFGKFSFRLGLPAGFAFVEASRTRQTAVSVKTAGDGSSVVTYPLQTNDSKLMWRNFSIYTGQEVMVRADGAVGTEGEGSFQVFYDGKPVSAVNRFTLRTIAPIRVAKPKDYSTGIHCHETWRQFPFLEQNAVGNRMLGDFMNGCGVDWVIGAVRQDTVRDWRARGIRYFTPVCGISNGFQIEPSASRPEEERFLDADGKRRPNLSCPCAVYEESGHFLKEVVKGKQSCIRQGNNGIWSNWEPGGHLGNGCYCGRCRKSFAAWSGKDEADLAKDWPACVRKGGRFLEDWTLFHGWQLAEIVKTIDRHVRAAGGEDNLGFIPGVAWCDRCSDWKPAKTFTDPQRTSDYAGSLKWINYWGPYVTWKTSEGYAYDKRKPIAHFISALDVRETIDATYPPERRPKIMMMPNGQQGLWTVQPEWIKMGMDSYFFNRWDATLLYFFPCGVDARYWKAFADSTALSAKYEDIVRRGRDVSADVTLEPISPYAVPCRVVTMETPKWRNVSPLLQKAYAKDGVTAVAAFNFWEKGEVFFRLRVRGLKGRFHVVSSDRTLFARDAERMSYDGAELAERGVIVHLGAARSGVFEIVPEAAAHGATSILTAADLKARFKSVRAQLQSAAAEDARREALNDFDPPKDVMTVL